MHPIRVNPRAVACRIEVIRPVMLEKCVVRERRLLSWIRRIFYAVIFGLLTTSALLYQQATSGLRHAGFALIAVGSGTLVLGILTDRWKDERK